MTGPLRGKGKRLKGGEGSGGGVMPGRESGLGKRESGLRQARESEAVQETRKHHVIFPFWECHSGGEQCELLPG